MKYIEKKWRDTNHIYDNEYIVKIYEDMGKYIHGAWSDFWDCEVIGNKFDNPELLGV